MTSINNIENASKTRGKGLLQYTSNSCRKKLPLNLDSINSVRLVDLEELVDLMVKWYENMPNDVRELLSLQKMYVPE